MQQKETRCKIILDECKIILDVREKKRPELSSPVPTAASHSSFCTCPSHPTRVGTPLRRTLVWDKNYLNVDLYSLPKYGFVFNIMIRTDSRASQRSELLIDSQGAGTGIAHHETIELPFADPRNLQGWRSHSWSPAPALCSLLSGAAESRLPPLQGTLTLNFKTFKTGSEKKPRSGTN